MIHYHIHSRTHPILPGNQPTSFAACMWELAGGGKPAKDPYAERLGEACERLSVRRVIPCHPPLVESQDGWPIIDPRKLTPGTRKYRFGRWLFSFQKGVIVRFRVGIFLRGYLRQYFRVWWYRYLNIWFLVAVQSSNHQWKEWYFVVAAPYIAGGVSDYSY